MFTRGALWNTFVGVGRATTFWEMTRQAASDLYHDFMAIGRALSTPRAAAVLESVYHMLRSVNFSAEICVPLTSRLRVLPVAEVSWSDWGTVDRILASLHQLGKLEEISARLPHGSTVALP